MHAYFQKDSEISISLVMLLAKCSEVHSPLDCIQTLWTWHCGCGLHFELALMVDAGLLKIWPSVTWPRPQQRPVAQTRSRLRFWNNLILAI